jgi:hypothetical protein
MGGKIGLSSRNSTFFSVAGIYTFFSRVSGASNLVQPLQGSRLITENLWKNI